MNILNMSILEKVAILREKTPLFSSIIAGLIVGICLLALLMPQVTDADLTEINYASYVAKQGAKEAQKISQKIKVIITAYSSTPEETDDTPFITASGSYVKDGVVANNMLPMGTKIRIPELYGDKVFTIEDRMNRRKSDYHFDIWFPSKELAINFGVKTAELEVLED